MKVMLLGLVGSILPLAPCHARDGSPDADLRSLRAFSRELRAMEAEMRELRANPAPTKRGYFTAEESAAVEGLLFRYLLCRNALREIVDARRESAVAPAETEEDAKALIVGLNAAIKLRHYSSLLVDTCGDDPLAVSKLNQAFPVSAIPRGTFDELFRAVTAVDDLRALNACWEIFRGEAGDPNGPIFAVSLHHPEYRELVAENYRFMAAADAALGRILERHSMLLPDVRNRIRHSDVMDIVRKARETFGDNLYAARGLLFNSVGRVHSPVTATLTPTAGDFDAIAAALEPGDIILTYSSGYMSNIFLPGTFKHGMTYVGSPARRSDAGLSARLFESVPQEKRRVAVDALAQSDLGNGREADVIEAVAEGVIFNSLRHLLESKVNRMVALRPRLNREQRVEALKSVFLHLGGEYDFKFDFGDATYVCCTEVIYRSFEGKGPIRLELTPRMGRPTLSADDILLRALNGDTDDFDVVLLVVPETDGKVRIREGADALLGTRELLAAQ